MAKNTIKLNSAQLHKLIAESVKKVLREEYNPYPEVGSTAEKVARDAELDRQPAQNYKLYQQECNELVQHFQACMQILSKIDASDYDDSVEEVDWFLHDIYNFLEDYAIRIKKFANGDLSDQNLYSEKYSDK
jgi:hypothetical protein